MSPSLPVTVHYAPAVIADALAHPARRRHPVQRLVGAAVGVHEHRSVGLDHQHPGRHREVRGQPSRRSRPGTARPRASRAANLQCVRAQGLRRAPAAGRGPRTSRRSRTRVPPSSANTSGRTCIPASPNLRTRAGTATSWPASCWSPAESRARRVRRTWSRSTARASRAALGPARGPASRARDRARARGDARVAAKGTRQLSPRHLPHVPCTGPFFARWDSPRSITLLPFLRGPPRAERRPSVSTSTVSAS